MPWQMSMNYRADVKLLRNRPVDDPNLRFTAVASRASGEQLRAQTSSAS